MKIRTDYVTNSSSSSFILVFDTEKDYASFQEESEYYKQFGRFIRTSLKNAAQEQHRKEAVELLKLSYEKGKYENLILSEKFEDYRTNHALDMLTRAWDYEKTQEYQDKLQEYLEHDEKYQQQLSRINNANTVVCDMIWDTNGGIMEWAIRNGFLEDNFPEYLVLCWNVG